MFVWHCCGRSPIPSPCGAAIPKVLAATLAAVPVLVFRSKKRPPSQTRWPHLSVHPWMASAVSDRYQDRPEEIPFKSALSFVFSRSERSPENGNSAVLFRVMRKGEIAPSRKATLEILLTALPRKRSTLFPDSLTTWGIAMDTWLFSCSRLIICLAIGVPPANQFGRPIVMLALADIDPHRQVRGF
jgi:hypothetical protein